MRGLSSLDAQGDPLVERGFCRVDVASGASLNGQSGLKGSACS